MKTKVLSLVALFMFSVVGVFAADKTESFEVKGAGDQCKILIEKAAKDVEGVSMAEWDQDKQELVVMYDDSQTDRDAIEKAVAKTGHNTPDYKATEEDYKNNPHDCIAKDKDDKVKDTDADGDEW